MTSPGQLLAAVAGALLTVGFWLAWAGLRRVPVPQARPRVRRARTATGWRSGTASTSVLAGVGVGLAVALATGWWIAVVLLPAAVLTLPPLLRPAPTRHIERLEATEEWARSLAGVLTAGVGLEQAIVVSLRSTPEAIRPEVAALVGRLRSRWPTEDAIRAFADDLDDATGDLVAAKLVLASRRRGPGLANVLESLAESVAADVRTRRHIEADRDRPRAAVRWVTVITLGTLILLSFNGTYLAPYRTPTGQLVLVLLLGVDLLCLLWMRAMTRPVPAPRFIGSAVRREPG